MFLSIFPFFPNGFISLSLFTISLSPHAPIILGVTNKSFIIPMLTSYELYKYSIIVSFSIQQAGFITHFFSLLHLVNPPVLRYDKGSTPS